MGVHLALVVFVGLMYGDPRFQELDDLLLEGCCLFFGEVGLHAEDGFLE